MLYCLLEVVGAGFRVAFFEFLARPGRSLQRGDADRKALHSGNAAESQDTDVEYPERSTAGRDGPGERLVPGNGHLNLAGCQSVRPAKFAWEVMAAG